MNNMAGGGGARGMGYPNNSVIKLEMILEKTQEEKPEQAEDRKV